MSDRSIRRVFDRLAEGELFAQYHHAFLAATGLPLNLVFSEEERWVPCMGGANESPFCRDLHAGKHVCEGCIAATKALRSKLPCGSPSASVTCFAGMEETAVPVRLGGREFAYLKTGQVFVGEKTEADFEKASKALAELGFGEERLEGLRRAYFETPAIDGSRYEGIVALLAIFARQLSHRGGELLLVQENSEPEAVQRARRFIRANLDRPLRLPEVAAHVGVSPHHFSRVFKRATGLSFTAFVTHSRISRAKEELLKPNARVTEVAYDVGFQSLSQFNRSFAHVVGETPTEYRRWKIAGSMV